MIDVALNVLLIYLCAFGLYMVIVVLYELFGGSFKKDKGPLNCWFSAHLYLVSIVIWLVWLVWLVFESLYKLLRWAIQYSTTTRLDRVRAQQLADTLRIEKQRATEIRRIGNETRQQMYQLFDDHFDQ